MKRILLLLLVVVLGAGAAWWYLHRGAANPAGTLQGYIEGYLVFVAAEEGGLIAQVRVKEGSTASPGEVVVELDKTIQLAQRDEASAKLAQARSTLTNLKDALQRPEQIAVLQAQEDRAKAGLDYSRREFERQTNLESRGFATTAALDQSRAAYDRDVAALAEAKRQIEAARLGARTGEIEAAAASVEAAAAALLQAETRLAKRTLVSPALSVVQDIFFRVGEVVDAGQPILSLLPEGNRRVRLFVPEPRLSTFALDQAVEIGCDGCKVPIEGRITFISSQAEYTPPVIFSQTERAKLVFRVEATLAAGVPPLPLGLPVDVRTRQQTAAGQP